MLIPYLISGGGAILLLFIVVGCLYSEVRKLSRRVGELTSDNKRLESELAKSSKELSKAQYVGTLDKRSINELFREERERHPKYVVPSSDLPK